MTGHTEDARTREWIAEASESIRAVLHLNGATMSPPEAERTLGELSTLLHRIDELTYRLADQVARGANWPGIYLAPDGVAGSVDGTPAAQVRLAAALLRRADLATPAAAVSRAQSAVLWVGYET
jgi:hypothetical protein